MGETKLLSLKQEKSVPKLKKGGLRGDIRQGLIRLWTMEAKAI